MSENFQQRYCRHFNLAPEQFTESLLNRALYRRVHLVRPLILLFDRDYFTPDRHFVEGVGRLTHRRDFHAEVKDFQFHPENRGLFRGQLRLRASANRLARVFFEVWQPEAPETGIPDTVSGAPFEPGDTRAPQSKSA